MSQVPSTDFIVIGSGIAGMSTALKASQYGRVVLFTKGRMMESNTYFAQGGIAAAMGPGDTPEAHHLDTLTAGADLCEPNAVSILVRSGPDRVRELIDLGTRFDTTPSGTLAFGREAAHSLPRILHARGDATGAEIASVLARAVRREPSITIYESAFVIDIIVERDRCVGCWVYHPEKGVAIPVFARACVIATGGCGQLYQFTTNPWVATGDGLAMAYRAGARLVDMEFVQFHPTALAHFEDPMVLVSEAVRGEGATLIDSNGERFMTSVHPLAELAPRDVVARAIFSVMQQGHEVFLDATSLGEGFRQRFPSIDRACRQRGIDPTATPIPITPAAHFIMGGIHTDTYGRTSVPGLYACGEAACTGVHGANRLASNSLLEGLVFAERVGRTMANDAPDQIRITTSAQEVSDVRLRQPNLEQRLRILMWDHAGLIRSQEGLEAAQRGLDEIETKAAPHAKTLHNMLCVARSIVNGALHRTESRGGHYRSDHPTPAKEWLRRHIFHQIDAAAPWVETRTD